MGDSGSWVVHGSKLLGHVFAVQEETSWSYMIPITQVVDDIQKSLLAYSIELPTQENHVKVSSLCPKDGRSHASLVAFGVNACPNCEQDLNSPEHPHEKGSYPKDTFAELELESLVDHLGSSSSSGDSYASLPHSDPSIRASTVPTSYYAQHGNVDLKDKNIQEVPLAGETMSWNAYWRISLPRNQRGPNFPYIALEAALDEVHQRNNAIERRIKTDASVVLDLSNPINDNVRTTRITLNTPSLNSALRHVVHWDPLVNPRFRQIVVHEPYAVLVRHFHELTAYASEIQVSRTETQPSSASEHKDIDALIDFTQRVIEVADVATEYSRHERNACIFSKLWLLFYPGITVYANVKDTAGLAAYVVRSVQTDTSILRPLWQSNEPYILHLWRLNYDGQYVKRQTCSVAIDYFEGERDISSLKVFPCEYLDKVDCGKTRSELEDRGRRWYQLLRGGATYYDGELPAEPDLVGFSLSNHA